MHKFIAVHAAQLRHFLVCYILQLIFLWE